MDTHTPDPLTRRPEIGTEVRHPIWGRGTVLEPRHTHPAYARVQFHMQCGENGPVRRVMWNRLVVAS